MSSGRNLAVEAGVGVGVSGLAAFVYALFVVGRDDSLRAGEGFLFSLLGVAVFSWFIIPIGAVMGVCLPRLVASRPAAVVVLVSVLASLAIAGMVCVIFTALGNRSFRWGVTSGGLFPLLSAYCLPWVLAAGFGWRSRVRA